MRRVLLVLLCLLASVPAASPARAAEGGLTVSPSAGPPGTEVTLTEGPGFECVPPAPPEEGGGTSDGSGGGVLRVNVFRSFLDLEPDPETIGSEVTFPFTTTIPAHAEGRIQFIAVCSYFSGATSNTVAFTVTDPETPGPETPPPTGLPDASVRVSPDRARAGVTVALVPADFPDGCAYSARLGDDLVTLSGLTFRVPPGTAPGRYQVVLGCRLDSGYVRRAATLTVVAGPSSPGGDRDDGSANAATDPSEGSFLPDGTLKNALGDLAEDWRPVAAAVGIAVASALAFLAVRALALGDRLVRRERRGYPRVGFPAEPVNKALEHLNQRRKREIPPLPWLQFLGGVAIAAAAQTLAADDSRGADGRLDMTAVPYVAAGSVIGLVLVVATWAAVLHWRETRALDGGFGPYRTLWIGLALAVVMAFASWALRLEPGYVYGIIGYFVIAEIRGEAAREDKLAAIVMAAWATFAAAVVLWLAWAGAEGTQAVVLKTALVLVLETAVFALLPIPLLDGAELIQNRPAVWIASFVPMCTAWCLLVWRLAESDSWTALLGTAALLGAMAVLSYPLWSHARHRASREAQAATDTGAQTG